MFPSQGSGGWDAPQSGAGQLGSGWGDGCLLSVSATVGRERRFQTRALIRHEDPSLLILSKPDHLPKVPTSYSIILGVRASVYEFVGVTGIQL